MFSLTVIPPSRGISIVGGFALLLLVYVSLTSGVRVSSKLRLRSSSEKDSSFPGIGEHGGVLTEDFDTVTHEAAGDSQSHAAESQGGADDDDADTRISFELKAAGHMRAVSATMKGRRPTDEDEVRTLEQLNSNTYFMGLFDGHGGPETSKYLRENAQDAIADAINARSDAPIEYDEEKIAKACVELDKKIVKADICKDSGSTVGHNSQKCNILSHSNAWGWLCSGATSTTGMLFGLSAALSAAMLIVEKDTSREGVFKVHSIYIGDSRAHALNFDGSPIPLSEDHKPNLPEEKARIEAAGGDVVSVDGVWRVGGSLALSRAFGDSAFKDYELRNPWEQQVIAVPGHKTTEVSYGTLLLLACDGLSETVDTDLEKIMKSAIEKSGGCLVRAVRELLLTAYDRGSGDNISVIAAVTDSMFAPPSVRRFSLGRHDEPDL